MMEVNCVQTANSAAVETFSITRGGPFHRLLIRLFRDEPEHERVVRRAVFATALAWLPLFLLSAAQGSAFDQSAKITFVRDFAVNVRFLVALPILILAESPIDRRWRTLVLEFLRTHLVHEDQVAAFDSILNKIMRMRDHFFPELVLLVLAYLPSFLVHESEILLDGANWHFLNGTATLSLAGWWFKIISMPLFRFLLLRWFWRLILWTTFLWRVSRTNLHLVATHADRSAGLGFLSEGQVAFSPIVFAGSSVIASQVGNAVAYEGATLASLKFVMIGYGVLALVILVLPLLVVVPTLIKVKKRALFEYGGLVTRHNQLFDAKWIEGRHSPSDEILGSSDASSLANLGTSFGVIRDMSFIPLDKPTLIGLTVAALLPMIPVIVFTTPLNDLIKIVTKALF
jgi:hypothetical protein